MKTKIFYIILAFTTFCNAQIINIPDANFKAKLLSSSSNQIAKNLAGQWFNIDTNNDGEIQQSEAINVSYLSIVESNISSLSGINAFINLKFLYCYNNQLSSINLLTLTNLEVLSCENNQLTSIEVQGLANLKRINCSYNQLTSMNLSGLSSLYEFKCYYNQLSNLNVSSSNLNRLECHVNNLTSINLTNQTALQYLVCNNNMLSTLNLNGLINLTYFICGHNQLAELNVDDLLNLERLDCNNNSLTTLNLNNRTKLINLDCSNNQLISLFIKNGKVENPLNFYNNPNLQYICADEGQLLTIENSINVFGYSNCNVNSYCSFTPNGTFYTIQGNSTFDYNSNGCDSNDIVYPNFKCSISNGINTGTFIANNSGSYNIPVQSGTHAVTPVIENPTYFNVAPNFFNVSFPTATSPYNQDFCITANGNHNDLEVVLLPINQARPGFDAHYKLIYKNKGTTTQSGTINFTFDDSVLDFVSSNPNFSNQSIGSLTWNFTNLLPFESREINIVLNLNSPTETPALNSGDLLNFTATVNGQMDEIPNDNIATLNQIVVNSYDPNDKTCLEGTTITPTMVGEYIHYLIRFENNGTANAQNIVVKDMIDINKFDINTLIPIKGSHNFETRISNTNKVEFIFQNINLPFDDANNDGYISFKIKTKSNLVVGNTFSNSANIYFDYNFPIVTNNYTTTIQNTLGLQENYFINDIVAYPNPVKDFLSFKTENKIYKIEVYDIAGRILTSNSISENKIDLSELKIGNYILKLYTEKGIMNTKIIKE